MRHLGNKVPNREQEPKSKMRRSTPKKNKIQIKAAAKVSSVTINVLISQPRTLSARMK